MKTCVVMPYHHLNFRILVAHVWHVRSKMAGKGGERTFGRKMQKTSAHANAVYFPAYHKFSKRACSKTLPSKIWGFNLTTLKRCTRKTVFLFTLKYQLFPCIFSRKLSSPQRHSHFLSTWREIYSIPKYHRRSFSNFEVFCFEKKKFSGSEKFHFLVNGHLKSHFPCLFADALQLKTQSNLSGRWSIRLNFLFELASTIFNNILKFSQEWKKWRLASFTVLKTIYKGKVGF